MVASRCSWVAAFALALAATACGPSYDRVANLNSQGEAVVFFGDSLTAGAGAKEGEDYPSLVAQALPYPVVNAGVRGNTTTDALSRLESDVFPHNPRIVVILLGGNDYLKKVPVEETRDNLVEIIRSCQTQGAMVVVVGIKIGIFGDALGEIYEQTAREKGAWYIENVWKGIFGNPKLMSDTIHPNAAGYAAIAERLVAELKPLLQAADGARR